MFNPVIDLDSWEVDHRQKVIKIDRTGLISNYSEKDQSQLSGANQGHGINLLSEGFGRVGAGIADLADLNPEIGRNVGKGVFLVSSIAAGSLASIKILRIPGKAAMSPRVGGHPSGVLVGFNQVA